MSEEESKPKTLGGIDRSVTPFWKSGVIVDTGLYSGLTAENLNAMMEIIGESVYGGLIEIVSAAEYARRTKNE